MLTTCVKFATVVWLAGALVACDNPDSKKPEIPKPEPKPIVTQPAAPPVAPVAESVPQAGLPVSLQQGRITFELPPGFSDQTKYSGIINDSKSTIQLFLDSKSRQRTVSSEVIPPEGMKLSSSDAMLKELMQSMITELADRYQNIKKTREESFTVGKQRFRRLDSEQNVSGQQVVSTIVVTVFNKRVVTLQILSPAKTPQAHQALVQRIIETMVVK